MSKEPKVPSYRLHRASGQAFVMLGKQQVYLGKHDTSESRAEYRRVIAEWLGSGGAVVPGPAAPDRTVLEVLGSYWVHAKAYYSATDGSMSSQADRVKRSLDVAMALYGPTSASAFGPLALRACREEMVRSGLCRRAVNQRVDCIKRAFKWAASEELIPGTVYQSLRSLEGLRKGRCHAPDHPPVGPAPEASISGCLPYLPPVLADVVRFQLLTAARPGEALAIRECDLDTSHPVWVYTPPRHKTSHHGHRRRILIGPRCQALLVPYLRPRCPLCHADATGRDSGHLGGLCRSCANLCDGWAICGPWPACWAREERYLFSAADAERARLEAMRKARKTPVQPSQVSRAVARPRKKPGDRYQPQSYARAVVRACKRAGVERFHPHTLRHSAATRLVAEFGWEIARIILGHRSVDVTRIYAEDDVAKAIDAARKAG